MSIKPLATTAVGGRRQRNAGNANSGGARCAGSRPLRHYRDRRRAAPELQPHTSVLGAGGREDACRNRHSTFQLVREARHSLDRRQTGARTGAASAARSTNRSTCCRGLSRPRVLDWPRHIWLLGRYRVQSDGEWCLPASPISITNSIGGCAIDPRKPKCATPFAGSRRFIGSIPPSTASAPQSDVSAAVITKTGLKLCSSPRLRS